MAGSYQWLTFSQAVADLAQRLSDPSMDFWAEQELQIIIQQALRVWNSMTWMWKADFTFSSNSLWNSLGLLAGSPRLYTITDQYCYTEMEMMLLEPPSGSVWTGTNQFSISDLSDALLRRRNQMVKVANSNQSLLTGIPLTPNTTRTYLPDSVVDVERVRYLAGPIQSGFGQGGYGQGGFGGTYTPPPVTLYRDDTIAQEFYEAPLYQQSAGTPNTFSLSSEPPLSWDVDIPPNLPGTYEAVVNQAPAPFDLPAVSLLNIPDDFAYVAEWGALADILGQESESTDRERSEYAAKRYEDGCKLLKQAPWIALGKVNGVAVSCDSIVDLDRYSPEWDSNPTGFGPVIVTGGPNWIAAPVGAGIGLTLYSNAPVPILLTDYLQVSKGSWDTILSLAQSRACFKMGGAEWRASLELEKHAILAASQENIRLRSLGAFSDILVQRGTAQERAMNRYNNRGSKQTV